MFVMYPSGDLRPCRLAASFASRLAGLLGTAPGSLAGGAVLLRPCTSVHTFSMAYPIDVAFLDGEGVVVKAVCDLRPGKMVAARGAQSVLERESDGSAWFREGDRVVFITS